MARRRSASVRIARKGPRSVMRLPHSSRIRTPATRLPSTWGSDIAPGSAVPITRDPIATSAPAAIAASRSRDCLTSNAWSPSTNKTTSTGGRAAMAVRQAMPYPGWGWSTTRAPAAPALSAVASEEALLQTITWSISGWPWGASSASKEATTAPMLSSSLYAGITAPMLNPSYISCTRVGLAQVRLRNRPHPCLRPPRPLRAGTAGGLARWPAAELCPLRSERQRPYPVRRCSQRVRDRVRWPRI